MALIRRPPVFPAEVVSDPEVMSGDPVVRGTRVPAHTVLACLRAGETHVEIFEAYPPDRWDRSDHSLGRGQYRFAVEDSG